MAAAPGAADCLDGLSNQDTRSVPSGRTRRPLRSANPQQPGLRGEQQRGVARLDRQRQKAVDQLAEAEGENWVYEGTDCLAPDYNRCLITLSRGGSDAAVRRVTAQLLDRLD